jgi:hypothetical protein
MAWCGDTPCLVASALLFCDARFLTGYAHRRFGAHGQVGELLSDWRRLNVAFTRAKKKLVVVGSAVTLQASPICAAFLDIVRPRQWISDAARLLSFAVMLFA